MLFGGWAPWSVVGNGPNVWQGPRTYGGSELVHPFRPRRPRSLTICGHNTDHKSMRTSQLSRLEGCTEVGSSMFSGKMPRRTGGPRRLAGSQTYCCPELARVHVQHPAMPLFYFALTLLCPYFSAVGRRHTVACTINFGIFCVHVNQGPMYSSRSAKIGGKAASNRICERTLSRGKNYLRGVI